MRAQGDHMQMLVNGQSINIMAGQPDTIAGTVCIDVIYSLSAHPSTVDFVTDWQLREDIFAAA
jgi:hypothetical protein